MWSYLLRRVLAVIPVLLVVTVIVFLMLRLTPGDPAANIAGDAATSEDIEQLREDLGLNRPLPVQFGIYLKNLFRGDFGESFYYKRPVTSMIADGVEPTVSLALFTIVIACAIAIPLGTLAAYRHGSWLDRAVMGFSVIGFSVPVFVIGYALIYVLSVKLEWFPVQGYQSIAEGIGGWAYRLILPSTALSVIFVALIATDHPHQRAGGAERGLRADRAREGVAAVQGADAPRAAQCRGADRDDHRHRHRGPGERGGGDRERVRDPGPRIAHPRCDPGAGLPDGAGADHPVLGRVRRDQPADRPHLHAARPADPLLRWRR